MTIPVRSAARDTGLGHFELTTPRRLATEVFTAVFMGAGSMVSLNDMIATGVIINRRASFWRSRIVTWNDQPVQFGLDFVLTILFACCAALYLLHFLRAILRTVRKRPGGVSFRKRYVRAAAAAYPRLIRKRPVKEA